MAYRKRSRPRRGGRKRLFIHNDRGVICPRAEKVGAEHFGIVSVDCAKARSKWMLATFHGRILVEPTEVDHDRVGLQRAVLEVRRAVEKHKVRDFVVSIERTGRYHEPIQRTFGAEGWDVRVIHPTISRQYRQVVAPHLKTDDNDLKGIHLGTFHGAALLEPVLEEPWNQLLVWSKHRRDLVKKSAALRCQIKESVEVTLPGYTSSFKGMFDSKAEMAVLLEFSSPEAIRELGREGLEAFLRDRSIRFRRSTVAKILDWACRAPSPGANAAWYHRIVRSLHADWAGKRQEILEVERDMGSLLVKTPYLLLVSIPGIHLTSAADLAAVAGPIARYHRSKSLTGRAGLFPSRYQSDQVDVPGQIVPIGYRPLRAVLMRIASNLLKCNTFFRRWANQQESRGRGRGTIRMKMASRLARIVFAMVSGEKCFSNPACRGRDTILRKVLDFHQDHRTLSVAPQDVLRDLKEALRWISGDERSQERVALQEKVRKVRRRRGIQPLADILPIVLAGLGEESVES